MTSVERRWWQRYVPAYARNPFRLAWQLLTERKPAARSALWMAAAGIALTPLDLLFVRTERRHYERAPAPHRPLVLVCGPPRSGTTLVAQFLINHLDVAYLNNLTSLFPRSPIHANRRFARWAVPRAGDYEAFYGKSRGLAGANDALYLWDRWLGTAREKVPERLEPGAEARMPQFFGALETLYGRPVVNKVNRLNTCAHLVADIMPNARFICIRRDPLYLAQSLYVARERIVGDPSVAYGVQHEPVSSDPIEDVCLQVDFHERQARRQRQRLGEDRFAIVSYEEFCESPGGFLDSYLSSHGDLKIRVPGKHVQERFDVSNQRRMPKQEFDRMSGILKELDVETVTDFRR